MSRSRELLRRFAPALVAQRARRYERRHREKTGATDVARDLARHHGARVLRGPFEGTTLDVEMIPYIDAAAAKLLGAYESEIAEVFDTSFPVFVDIGCADGYYAVGVAVAHPGTQVLAYDLADSARQLCAATARLNDVEGRVVLRRAFDLEAARSIDLTGALVLCDIEGAERDLFSADMAAAMRDATVIVELHEVAEPEVFDHVTSVFAASHAVQVVDQERRDPRSFPELVGLSADRAAVAVDEMRGESMRWLILRPLR